LYSKPGPADRVWAGERRLRGVGCRLAREAGHLARPDLPLAPITEPVVNLDDGAAVQIPVLNLAVDKQLLQLVIAVVEQVLTL
jgi:hypothetical protein